MLKFEKESYYRKGVDVGQALALILSGAQADNSKQYNEKSRPSHRVCTVNGLVRNHTVLRIIS